MALKLKFSRMRYPCLLPRFTAQFRAILAMVYTAAAKRGNLIPYGFGIVKHVVHIIPYDVPHHSFPGVAQQTNGHVSIRGDAKRIAHPETRSLRNGWVKKVQLHI